MEVVGVDAAGRDIPLADDFPVSYEEHTTTDHVFVRLRTDNGTTGYGEGTALPWFTGETTASMVSFVTEWAASRVEGCTLAEAAREFEEFRRAFPGNPGGKAAIELALLDLQAKQSGLPVRDLIGVTRRETVPCVYPVPGLSPDRARAVADAGLDRGFRRFKIKATGDIEADVARINAVLEQLPAGATARVDANTGWRHFPLARRAVQGIEDLAKVEYFEQPVDADRPADLRRLWEQTGIEVYADEFVHGPSDVERLGREELAAGCHLKLAKTGSLRELVHMATVADRYGLSAVAVSAFGTSVEAAAVLNLAAVIPRIPLACELDPGLIAEDPSSPSLTVEPETPVPDGPGLGVELDDTLFD